MSEIKKYWNKIFFLGFNELKIKTSDREIVTTNQVNLLVLVFMLIFVGITVFDRLIGTQSVGFGTIRMCFILITNILILLFLHIKWYRIAKILLIFIPVTFFFILPSVFGFAMEESFIYYPYGIAAFSIIPTLILNCRDNRFLLGFSLIVHLVYILVFDFLIDRFVGESFKIKDLIAPFYLYYKIAPVSIFLFIQFTILFLRKVNLQFENDLIRKNLETENQKNELENLNEEIVVQRDELTSQRDSILLQQKLIKRQNNDFKQSVIYASKIQKAIFPGEDYMTESLPKHFVFYQPRDVVSGDFYWIEKKGDRVYIALGDCTGHGVPGAFMSILGISILKEIFSDFEEADTNNILDEMKSRLISALRQTGKYHEAKDGMDMSLVSLNTKNLEVQFSGAQHNMLLFHNNEFIEVKGDRMPVGIHFRDEKKFSMRNLKLVAGDTFYLYSDGYTDQFGGDKGKKLGKTKFKELLRDIQHLVMRNQRKAIEKAFINWKAEKDQIDDVLVIGVRV